MCVEDLKLEDFFHCETCGQPIDPDDGICSDCDPWGEDDGFDMDEL